MNQSKVTEIQIEDDIEKLLGMENNTKNTDETSEFKFYRKFCFKEN